MISAGSDLHVYDITKSKVRKSFSLKSNITSFTVNHCDAYIAVGCSDGSLNLATLATNQVSSPMVAPKCGGQKVTSVKYSCVKVGLHIKSQECFHNFLCSLPSLAAAVRVALSHSGIAMLTRISST